MIALDVVRIGQEYDLKQRVTVNFLYLELPGGHVIRAIVSDTDAAAVIAADVQSAGAPMPVMAGGSEQAARPPAAPMAEGEITEVLPLPFEVGDDGTEFAVFGGEEPAAAPSAPRRAAPPLQRPSPRQRRVEMDEAGNPIVPRDGVDPDSILGLRSAGEAPAG